ncbi:MAG: hypothetical protein WBC04_20820 [Candidatus Acidiferrales bacterium]
MRKLLFSASLAALLLLGVSVRAHPNSLQSQSEKQSEQTKSVSGKVTSIGDGGHSFSLEVDESGNKRTMDFVVDKDTHIQGRVTTGTAVTVEYEAADGGQNIARTITTENS